MDENSSARLMVVSEARSWLGSPFMHAQRMKGVGVDCAQLLLACYCDTGLVAPIDPGHYSPDWFRNEDGQRLREWIASRCTRNLGPAEAGDIILFRFGRGESHSGISLGGELIIHAIARRGVVIDSIQPHSPLRKRLASVWTPSPWCNA